LTGKTVSTTDSDDKDRIAYVFDFGGYNLNDCGNMKKNVSVVVGECDVCTDLKVTLLDPSGLMDVLDYNNAVRCDPSTGDRNGCCGDDGCWDITIRGSCGYFSCPWEPVQWCQYYECECDSNGEEVKTFKEAVIMERQFADMCGSCGECICSGYLEPRFRNIACPANVECGECFDIDCNPLIDPNC